MKDTKIRPIPNYILTRIHKKDLELYPEQKGAARFYAYLTKNDGELVKVTVAVKSKRKEWYCKQCAVHGIHSEKCFVKDMAFFYLGGYVVGWYDEGLQEYRKWYEDRNWDWSLDKYFDPWASIVNLEYLTKIPEYRYSAAELFDGVNILKYLRIYEQFPQVEYLMKAGLKKLYDSKQILKKIENDKNFCKWLINHKDELIKEYHYIAVILRAYRTGKPLSELQSYAVAKIRLRHDNSLKPIRELFKGKELERFLSYIAKQGTNVNAYLDYRKACDYLGLDMSADKNCFPHNFKRWHDIRIDEYATAKAMKDQEERKELYKKFAAVADKYLSLEYDKRGAYVVMIAKSPADLIREGELLNHCVGRMNYDQRVMREESLIFFVRDIQKPDVPFVTVEYSPLSKKVLQCYGYQDKNPDDAVLTYVNKVWLPYANRAVKKLENAA